MCLLLLLLLVVVTAAAVGLQPCFFGSGHGADPDAVAYTRCVGLQGMVCSTAATVSSGGSEHVQGQDQSKNRYLYMVAGAGRWTVVMCSPY
jgi:hypothetical protein